MANIKSQIKRNRQNEKRRLRNRVFRGTARSAITDARTALKSGEQTQETVNAAISALDKAAQRGAIHPRNASRRKGRLMKQLTALGIQPKAAVAEPVKAVEKKSAKAEKEVKPAKEAKPKTEAAKKPAEKKTAEKKPAAKKTAAKK